MRILHWLMALILLCTLVMGLYMASIPIESPNKFDLYHWHRALGVLAFVLVIIRLITRLNANTPPTPVGLPAHEKLGSTLLIGHYMLMFALPLTGYIASSLYLSFPNSSVNIHLVLWRRVTIAAN